MSSALLYHFLRDTSLKLITTRSDGYTYKLTLYYNLPVHRMVMYRLLHVHCSDAHIPDIVTI